MKDDFLEDKDIKNSYGILNITVLKKVNSESFEKPYKNAYENELKKWKKIPVCRI